MSALQQMAFVNENNEEFATQTSQKSFVEKSNEKIPIEVLYLCPEQRILFTQNGLLMPEMILKERFERNHFVETLSFKYFSS